MRVFWASILLGLCAFAFAPAASAAGEFIDCDAPSAPPCFLSITRNPDTTPVTLHTNPFTGIGKEVIGGQTYLSDGARYWRFSIQDENGHFDLNTADVYEVVLDIGTANPAETFSRGQNVSIDRDLSDPDHHTVTFRMNGVPVSYTDSGCNGNGTCPMRPDYVTTGYLEAYVDNLGYISDPADEASMQGWDLVARPTGSRRHRT